MTDQILRIPEPIAFMPFIRSNESVEERMDLDIRTAVIGQVVTNFSTLEQRIELGVLRLLGSVPSNMSFEEKVDLLDALALDHNTIRAEPISWTAVVGPSYGKR